MLLVSIFSHSQVLGLIDVMGEPVFKVWAPDLARASDSFLFLCCLHQCLSFRNCTVSVEI